MPFLMVPLRLLQLLLRRSHYPYILHPHLAWLRPAANITLTLLLLFCCPTLVQTSANIV
jgi:hypothetical protein